MKYLDILHEDIANGPGLRVTLFVSGCAHHCPGCHNPESWDCNYGKELDSDAFDEINNDLQQDWCDGITISGGDPMFPSNRKEIATICDYLKEQYPNKTIMMYTGYKWEDIKNEIPKSVDILIDGPFIQEKRVITLKWRGSSNQRIIDVQASLKKKKIVLFS